MILIQILNASRNWIGLLVRALATSEPIDRNVRNFPCSNMGEVEGIVAQGLFLSGRRTKLRSVPVIRAPSVAPNVSLDKEEKKNCPASLPLTQIRTSF